MSKIAVIDIGSNSVRMVIFDAMARAPHYLFNEKAICRLGAGLKESGKLSPEGVINAKNELQRFVFVAKAMKVSSMEVVATAAVRAAKDGPEFCKWIKEELGQEVRVLSGEEEAQISAQGVLLGWPNADGLISDMGGSSMELINVHQGEIGSGYSTRLGPLNLESMEKAERKAFIRSELEKAFEKVGSSRKRLYLVGGSWRAFAHCDMLRKSYPFPILHEYTMSTKDIEKTIKFVKETGLGKLGKRMAVSPQRLELLPLASKVLASLVEEVTPDIIALSAYGLREGLLYENMPSWMRASDPLISAAEAMEQEFARVPGYGRKLFHWLAPLHGDLNDEEERVVRAACLLHDTNWRFHPDFRAQIGFELVAQANICGITHEERIFLALSLAARYQNNPEYAQTHAATTLLNQDEKERAWSLGRAMRLGAMLSASTPELLDYVKLNVEAGKLVLEINERYRALYGSSVEKRLEAVGKVMGRKVEIRMRSD